MTKKILLLSLFTLHYTHYTHSMNITLASSTQSSNIQQKLNQQLLTIPLEDEDSIALQKVKELVDAGAELNSKNERGHTQLIRSAYAGQKNTCSFLINRGAEVNYKNKHNVTPLMIAASANRPEVCKLLLKFGAFIDDRAKSKMTALAIACREGSSEASAVLVENGASLTIEATSKRPPLQCAVIASQQETCKAVIRSVFFVPTLENMPSPAESYGKIKTILLCLTRLQLLPELQLLILSHWNTSEKHLENILLLRAKESKPIPNQFVDLILPQIYTETIKQLKPIMKTAVYYARNKEKVRKVTDPDTVEEQFGEDIQKAIKKRIIQPKVVIAIVSDPTELT